MLYEVVIRICRFFFFKQKTAYEMRISDWSSDVCSSDLVQPVPAPLSTKAEPSSSSKAGTSRQKQMLFMRGNAMSGAPIISGTHQFPKPPISAGINAHKTMTRQCIVTSQFHRLPTGSPQLRKDCTPSHLRATHMITHT